MSFGGYDAFGGGHEAEAGERSSGGPFLLGIIMYHGVYFFVKRDII